jgi:hypothetical protein
MLLKIAIVLLWGRDFAAPGHDSLDANKLIMIIL